MSNNDIQKKKTMLAWQNFSINQNFLQYHYYIISIKKNIFQHLTSNTTLTLCLY